MPQSLLFWLSVAALVLTLVGAARQVPWWVPCFLLAFIECVSRYGAAGK